MFVTAWVGVLDYATGHVDYVNAGHNPPLLWRDGSWEWLREKSGMVLGLFDMPYKTHAVDCEAGDAFLLYTDGVTEAFDVEGALYGEERLLALVEGCEDRSPHGCSASCATTWPLMRKAPSNPMTSPFWRSKCAGSHVRKRSKRLRRHRSPRLPGRLRPRLRARRRFPHRIR